VCLPLFAIQLDDLSPFPPVATDPLGLLSSSTSDSWPGVSSWRILQGTSSLGVRDNMSRGNLKLGFFFDTMPPPVVGFVPTQYLPSVTPPTSAWTMCVQLSFVCSRTPNRLSRAEVATTDKTRQKEHFCLTNWGPPEIKPYPI
jgi:hypothetical protein